MKKATILILGVVIVFWGNLTAQTTIFFDSFEDGVLDTTYWQAVPGNVDPLMEVYLDNTAPDGFFSYRMGKTSDGDININELRLYLDLSGYEQVALEFWFKDFFDETGPFDEIRFSNDSAAISEKVFQLDPGSWTDNGWGKLPPLDVDGLAADKGLTLNDKFVIIFRQMGTANFSGNFNNDRDGFFIDAVHVYDPQTTYSPIPYTNGFESGTLDNIFSWAFPSYPPPGTTLQEYVRPGGWVWIHEDPSAPQGNWAIALGRRNDGNTTTNAIDLHLNLSGEDEVDLEFWIRDFFDENHEEDGIFFSDNRGRDFEKVFDFFPDSWNNNFWGKLPPIDVDRLAQEFNLALNDSFVIRFQQRGVSDFVGNFNSDRDGFVFDLVEVYDPNIIYVNSYPFFDGFESGNFQNMWRWANPFSPAATASDGELRIGGLVQVDQAIPHSGFRNVSMGRRNDGGSTTNALDLHLNLIGAVDVILNFWIADVFDENGPSDGIWFSNDAGETFTQIVQFLPGSWPNNVYQEVTIDISDSAAANNLELTDRCVIRFQQNGVADFSGNFNNDRDGFRIDDVSVTSAVAIDNEESPLALPGKFTLSQNYPNPFNPSTTIEFALPSAQSVSLKVYNALGQEVVALLSNQRMPAGLHKAVFEARDLPSGVYYYRISAGEFTEAKKMLLAR